LLANWKENRDWQTLVSCIGCPQFFFPSEHLYPEKHLLSSIILSRILVDQKDFSEHFNTIFATSLSSEIEQQMKEDIS